MSPELAALLDGPVADRFGRPTRIGFTTAGESIRPTHSVSLWLVGDGWSWSGKPDGLSHMDAEAIWLAHLLDVCGKLMWSVEMCPPPDVCVDLYLLSYSTEMTGEHNRIASEWHKDGLLAALARAMLAVPTEDRK